MGHPTCHVSFPRARVEVTVCGLVFVLFTVCVWGGGEFGRGRERELGWKWDGIHPLSYFDRCADLYMCPRDSRTSGPPARTGVSRLLLAHLWLKMKLIQGTLKAGIPLVACGGTVCPSFLGVLPSRLPAVAPSCDSSRYWCLAWRACTCLCRTPLLRRRSSCNC